MIHYANEKPMIAIVTPESQGERLDTFYYHPLFKDLDEKLDHASPEHVLVEDISFLVTDGTHQTPTYTDRNNGILFLSSTNISDKGIDLSDCKYITKKLHESLRSCQPQPGDVLIAKSGTVGTACVFPEGMPECSVYESVAIVRLKDGWNPEFLANFINSNLGVRQIQRSQKGIAVKHLHLGDLKDLRVPLISKNSQDEIVKRYNFIACAHTEILNACKKLTDKEHELATNQVDICFANELMKPGFAPIKNAKVFLQNPVLSERLDVPANHIDYTRLVDQIKTSPVAGTLADLVEVSDERYDPREHVGEEVHYLAIGDIDGITGQIIEPQVMPAEALPSRARRLIHSGDILIGIAGASTGTENMVVFPVSEDEEGWVASTGFIVLRPRNTVSVSYVCRLLKAPFILRQIRALLTSPSMPTISENDLLSLSVPVSDEKTRTKTLERIEAVLNKGKVLTTRLNDISKRADTLLARAKSNIFDLIDNKKFTVMAAEAEELKLTMKGINSISSKRIPRKKNGRKANIHFKRAVFAAEIVHRLHKEPTFGHVKFEKLLFLSEHLCGINTGSTYYRQAAGPYDNRALRSIDMQLKRQKWYAVQKDKNRYQYVPMEKAGQHSKYFQRYFSSIRPVFDKIIHTLSNWDTERCEIVATLYAAWNDLLKSGAYASDDAIIDQVLTHWHESKKRIQESRWRKALQWMKANGFSPEEALQ